MDLEKFFARLLMIVATIAVIAGVGCLSMVVTASGKIDYCRIIVYQTYMHEPVYVVVGHRAWREDVNVATADTAEDAAAKKAALCP